jgi:hypothetical protein
MWSRGLSLTEGQSEVERERVVDSERERAVSDGKGVRERGRENGR